MISDSSLISLNPDVLVSELDGDLIALDVVSGQYFSFNRMAAVIWHRLSVPTRFAALCTSLEAEFSARPGEVAQDVSDMLTTLKAEGLISLSD